MFGEAYHVLNRMCPGHDKIGTHQSHYWLFGKTFPFFHLMCMEYWDQQLDARDIYWSYIIHMHHYQHIIFGSDHTMILGSYQEDYNLLCNQSPYSITDHHICWHAQDWKHTIKTVTEAKFSYLQTKRWNFVVLIRSNRQCRLFHSQ